MLKIRLALAAVAAAPSMIAAQDTAVVATTKARAASESMQLPVRTFTLRRLSTTQAARLITPYVQGPSSGVFPGASSHELTVRATQPVLRVVDSLLRERDKTSPSVVLYFQLLAASDSAGDELPTDIGTALRSMFRFRGYRIVSQGSITTNEDQSFVVTLGTNEAARSPSLYRVQGVVESMTGDGQGSLPLTITLSRLTPVTASAPNAAEVFSTGLTVPIGQTVVLGSGAVADIADRPSAGMKSSVSTRALILAVRPDVIGVKRD